MRLNRFFGNFNLKQGEILVADKEFYNQIKNVLRLKIGDKIVLCDGKMDEADGIILSIEKNSIVLKISGLRVNTNEPKINVLVYCSVLKRENFELVAQKVTEIGARAIIPLITKHTVKQNINPERIKAIIREAAEQSGRGIIPELMPAISFENAVNSVSEGCEKILFDISGESLESISNKTKGVAIFIGPEGGWNDSEVKLAKDNGFVVVSLGKLVLRGETAAIVSAFKIING